MNVVQQREPARNGGARGFSMIEMLVAVAILAAVTMAIIGFVTTSLHLDHLARERSVATGLANVRLDQLTSMRFKPRDRVDEYKLPEETMAGADPEWTFTADYGQVPERPDFKRVTTITYDYPQAPLARVEVAVFWRNIRQGEKQHAMVTYLHPSLEKVQ